MVENGYLRNIVLGLIDKLNKAFLVLKLFGEKYLNYLGQKKPTFNFNHFSTDYG